jgi:DNA-binding NarL/FixJ family response regulator
MNGIEALKALRGLNASARVVMLTAQASSELVHQALDAGAQGYVVKVADSGDVVHAVRAAYSHERYLCPRAMAIGQRARVDSETSSPIARLSARERQVLQLVVEGHSSAQIAALVHLSPKSVDTYRSRLMRKLGVSNVVLLVRFAIRHGLVPLGDDL